MKQLINEKWKVKNLCSATCKKKKNTTQDLKNILIYNVNKSKLRRHITKSART